MVKDLDFKLFRFYSRSTPGPMVVGVILTSYFYVTKLVRFCSVLECEVLNLESHTSTLPRTIPAAQTCLFGG